MQQPDIHELSAYLDGELDNDERESIEAALAESETLRHELERLRAVRDWAREFPGRQPGDHPAGPRATRVHRAVIPGGADGSPAAPGRLGPESDGESP